MAITGAPELHASSVLAWRIQTDAELDVVVQQCNKWAILADQRYGAGNACCLPRCNHVYSHALKGR